MRPLKAYTQNCHFQHTPLGKVSPMAKSKLRGRDAPSTQEEVTSSVWSWGKVRKWDQQSYTRKEVSSEVGPEPGGAQRKGGKQKPAGGGSRRQEVWLCGHGRRPRKN